MQSSREGKSKSPLWQDKLYWLVPTALSALQLVYIVASNTHIHDEELAESIRNVFWLDHRLVYDGASSNVGYYGLLLLVYKIFGFSLHSAKYVRLIIYTAAMYSLAVLLQRFMRRIHATVIVATIGLSPTILFFDTIQTTYGLDILYGIICLLIILSLAFDGSPGDVSLSFLLGLIAMIAAMSYPPFLFYLPSLAFIYLWQGKRSGQKTTKEFLISTTCSAVGFIIPFLFAVFYMENTREFLNDPLIHKGLFRGGGKFQLDIQTFKNSLDQTLLDIFQRGTSYYYYLEHPDFSGPLGWIAVGGILAFGIFIAARVRSLRPILLLTGFHILLNLMVPSFTEGSGIRRSTGFLAGIYAWYAIGLYGLLTQSSLRKIKWIGVLTCFLFTANNLINYARNLETIKVSTNYSDTIWFTAKDTPQKSLEYWSEAIAQGAKLICYDGPKAGVPCDYAKIYAAIAGFRRWNGLTEVPVRAYDWNIQEYRTLSPDLWETHYFSH
jgi:hypothetical protein